MTFTPAVDITQIARATGISVEYQNLRGGTPASLPMRVAVIGQGNEDATYGLTKRQVFSAEDVGAIEGYGSPLYHAVQRLLPTNGDGVGTIPVTIYPLPNNVGGTASVGEIDLTMTTVLAAEYQCVINNIPCQKFSILDDYGEPAILAALKASIVATPGAPIVPGAAVTELSVTAKWFGPSGDDIYIEMLGPTDKGITWAITQPTGGTVGPDATEINVALAQVGDIWENFWVNCLNMADTTALDTYQTWGVGRDNPLVKKGCVFFTGLATSNVTTATAGTDARKSDQHNIQLVNPDSNDLPVIIAARQVARIAVRAQADPAYDYGSLKATGLTTGADGNQWTGTQRDYAVKRGSSTIQVKSGVVNISDVVTMYHPDGEELPPYRYLVDLVKIWNIVYNLNLLFDNEDWDGAPLAPDATPTSNPNTKKPKMAKAAVASLIDGLALKTILAEPEAAKATIVAEIDSENPKRINVRFTGALGGNTNIKSINYYFGFYFGTPAVVS